MQLIGSNGVQRFGFMSGGDAIDAMRLFDQYRTASEADVFVMALIGALIASDRRKP